MGKKLRFGYEIQRLLDSIAREKGLAEAAQLTRPDGRIMDMAAIRLTNLRMLQVTRPARVIFRYKTT